MKPKVRLVSILLVVAVYFPGGAQAVERLRIEPGTKIPVRLERSVGTKDFYQWKSFGSVRTVSGTLMQDIATSNGQVALPAGTRISLAVLESKRAGHVEGRSQLRLGLYSVATPDGEVLPLDGYANQLDRHHKVDKEGTAHGNRGLVKDAGVDFGAVTIGAGAGFLAFGPPGAVVGAGGGLVVAAIWTVARRGPDLVVPAGTVVDFVLGRPVSLVATGDIVDDGATLRPKTWGAGRMIAPSDDLLAMADQLDDDPAAVLQQLKQVRFKDRPPVDRVFARYLQGVARFQSGDHSSEPLNLIREAYNDSANAHLPRAARAEMARNLVVVMRATEKNWERDPLLNDTQVQAALVEAVQ